jgi:hypothetical protein
MLRVYTTSSVYDETNPLMRRIMNACYQQRFVTMVRRYLMLYMKTAHPPRPHPDSFRMQAIDAINRIDRA